MAGEKIEGYWKRTFDSVERHAMVAFVMAFLFLMQAAWGDFSIVCLSTAVVFAGAGAVVFRYRKPKRDKDDLRAVEIDLMGLACLKFTGSELKFKWTDLSLVRFNESKKGAGSVEFVGKGIRVVISQGVFDNYTELYNTLKRRIPRKRVRVEEREVDGPERELSEVEKAPTIIKDSVTTPPKQLFYYFMMVAYVGLLVVVFMGWGSIDGCMVAAAWWGMILAGWIYMPKILPMKSLETIRLTKEGALGTTFDGKKVELAWKDVLNVVIHFPPSTGGWQRHSGRISINGEKINLSVGLQFSKFGLIASNLNEICINRGIRIFTKGSPIVVHKPLEEAERKKLEKMMRMNTDEDED